MRACRRRRSPTSAPRRGSASTPKKSLPNWRSLANEDRRTTDRRGARSQRRRPPLLRAGRELSRRARRAARFADPHHRLPPGRRRRDDGRLPRQADRQARHLLRHPRPRRHQRLGRHPHRHAGFDARHPVHRPGRARHAASARPSRRSTTGASSAASPNGWSRSTTPARIPEFVTRAFAVATSGRPGSGRHRAARGRADRAGRGAGRPAAYAGRDAAGRSRTRRSSQTLLGKAKRPDRHPRRHRAGATEAVAGIADDRRSLVAAGRLLLPPPDAVRPSRIRTMPAMSASASIRSSRPAIKQADLVLLIGGRLGEMPSSDYTLLKSPYPDQTLVHVHPDAGELGRVYRPTLAINATPAAFVEAFAKRKPATAPAWAAETAEAARRLSRLVDAAGNRPGRRADGADHELSRNGAARRRHPHQRRRQLRDLGAPLPPLPPLRHAGRADLRLDGLRHAGRGRRQGAVSRPRSSSPLPATAAS